MTPKKNHAICLFFLCIMKNAMRQNSLIRQRIEKKRYLHKTSRKDQYLIIIKNGDIIKIINCFGKIIAQLCGNKLEFCSPIFNCCQN